MTETSKRSLPATADGRNVLDVALEASRTAGEIIRGGWNSDRQITFKGRADIVTDIDVAAEKAVLEIVTGAFPDFGVLAEESQPIAGASNYTWVVDPLDGTRNYAHGIPHFCTIVALADGADIVAGVIYDPVRDEMFSAAKGEGAFLNGDRIRVSESEELSRCLLSFDLGYVDEKAGLALDMIRSLWPGMYSVRMMGTAGLGLAYAASGRVDPFLPPLLVALGLGHRPLAGAGSRRCGDRPPGYAGRPIQPQRYLFQRSIGRGIPQGHRRSALADGGVGGRPPKASGKRLPDLR